MHAMTFQHHQMMRRLTRAGSALLAAGGVTLTLFWLMTQLVLAEPDLLEADPMPTIVFGEDLKVPPIETRPPRVRPQPPRVVEPPAVPQPVQAQPVAVDRTPARTPWSGAGLDIGPVGTHWETSADAASTGLVPIAVIQPRYPQDALLRGTEGWVRVRFEVGPDGRVLRAQVLDGEPPRAFERAALEAVRQWRFRVHSGPGALVGEQVIEFRIDAA